MCEFGRHGFFVGHGKPSSSIGGGDNFETGGRKSNGDERECNSISSILADMRPARRFFIFNEKDGVVKTFKGSEVELERNKCADERNDEAVDAVEEDKDDDKTGDVVETKVDGGK